MAQNDYIQPNTPPNLQAQTQQDVGQGVASAATQQKILEGQAKADIDADLAGKKTYNQEKAKKLVAAEEYRPKIATNLQRLRELVVEADKIGGLAGSKASQILTTNAQFVPKALSTEQGEIIKEMDSIKQELIFQIRQSMALQGTVGDAQKEGERLLGSLPDVNKKRGTNDSIIDRLEENFLGITKEKQQKDRITMPDGSIIEIKPEAYGR